MTAVKILSLQADGRLWLIIHDRGHGQHAIQVRIAFESRSSDSYIFAGRKKRIIMAWAQNIADIQRPQVDHHDFFFNQESTMYRLIPTQRGWPRRRTPLRSVAEGTGHHTCPSSQEGDHTSLRSVAEGTGHHRCPSSQEGDHSSLLLPL